MAPFELDEPRTLVEAAKVLDHEGHSVRAIAGGTAIMLMMKLGVLRSCRISGCRHSRKCDD